MKIPLQFAVFIPILSLALIFCPLETRADTDGHQMISQKCEVGLSTQQKITMGLSVSQIRNHVTPDFTVLEVSSNDDYAKDTHNCMAEYTLSVSINGEMKTVPILSSDSSWGRKLFIRLDGFSEDGKEVSGVIAKSGPDHFTETFHYDTLAGKLKD